MSSSKQLETPVLGPSTAFNSGTPYLGPRSGAAVPTQKKNIVLTEAGRAPWYTSDGNTLDAYIVGVAGGSASGKTSVAQRILKSLPNVPWVAIVSQDSFYKSLTRAQSKLAFENNYNFDHPGAFDYEDLRQCIADLRASRAVEIPQYSFSAHQRLEAKTYMYGASVVIVEGIFVLHDPAIRDLFNLKIFVQADSDLMLARRIRRDVKERGRDVEGIIDQYLRFVKPSYDTFVTMTSKHADIIVPGSNNDVALEVIAQHMRTQLDSRALRFRSELSRTLATPLPDTTSSSSFDMLESDGRAGPSDGASSGPSPSARTSATPLTSQGQIMSRSSSGQNLGGECLNVPPSVHVLEQTFQLRSLLTILHDQTTVGAEFIFTVNRIATLIVEKAMAMLPYRDKIVSLKTNGKPHIGKELDVDQICSISILRSGGVLEPSVRRAIPDLSMGSLLIQSSSGDGEPQLYNVSLPSFIRSRKNAGQAWVLLLDAQIGSGAAAFMGIRVLLDHGVREDRILFLSLLASAKGGIHALHRAFPKVRVVVGGVDEGLQKLRIAYAPQPRRADSLPLGSPDAWNIDGEEPAPPRHGEEKVVYAITPGMGNIGDRYWGTT